ncbi:hypothetical protein BKA67DRAFT_590998 [Truncatella angustata]|uniref:Zn(2)-C6 fungal-type domain-containing protein n=1 Tax=Truncatella angustata TaxID=152316 RepID=A0A9P8USD2_9PEZI|nr:uncharacterized protein BKA67DRAFT_590998 [Truncatella angustata]KAH6657582.1 hypothetical protein BKA67DRAFT_590998 [Truncatella angustata]
MESTAKPRKRACDSCYKRKIQCDGESPQCNWCKHHDLECTFDRPKRAANKVTKTRKEAKDKGLSQRIERLEQILAEKRKHDSSVSSSSADGGSGVTDAASPRSLGSSPARLLDQPPGADVVGSYGKLHFAGYQLGEISSYHGLPLFSPNGQKWIESRTGQVGVFPNLGLPLWHNPQLGHDALLVPASNFDLPDRQVTEEYFSLFCNSPIRLVFPIVEPELFLRTINTAYQPPPKILSSEHATAKACVFSFVCVVNLFEPLPGVPLLDIDACALKAQYLLPQVLIDASIEVLQVALMQCIYHLFSGKFQSASMFHTMACRILFMLGTHTHGTDPLAAKPEGETDESWRLECHLRKYFWMLYSFDKDIALRSGQPPVIPDDHCDLTLPKGYSKDARGWYIDTAGNPYLPGDLKLAMIKSKAVQRLHSINALRKSDAELLRDVRELDDELEEWRLSLDPSIRPKLSYRAEEGKVDRNTSISQKMHYIITNFEYHYLMATIHQTTSRCRSWYNRKSGEIEGVSSSLALSVEASRSTLVFLGTAVRELACESFWLMIFYPINAVLTVFCNILLNPLDTRAEADLKLLGTAPELIKTMNFRRHTIGEVIHIKMIEDFVAELVRLGSCAIQKARQTQHFEAQNPEELCLGGIL